LDELWGYYSAMAFSFVGLLGLFGYLFYVYRRKKKEGDSYKIDKENIVVISSFILLAGLIFVPSLMDLPNVLANKTEEHQGDCEVSLFDGRRTSYTLVHFENHKVTFPLNYQGAKDGNFYCELAYYPNTETGASLKLYTEKGGELVSTK
jgi:hypothetical protein